MIRQSSSRSILTAAALSLTLAAGVLFVPVPAHAVDDDAAWDTKILQGVLESMGLRKDGEAINYQERAPLVIPPSKTLPPPQNAEAAIANNPAWPKDPDVIRSKAEKAAALKDRYKSADEKFRDESRVLSPSELTPGAATGGQAPGIAKSRSASTWSETNQRLSPSQLGNSRSIFSNMFGQRDEDIGKFTGEPARTSLTEPPRGYQTPSAQQPYGLGLETHTPKATDYVTEHGTDTSK
jgi:hypothetical protein